SLISLRAGDNAFSVSVFVVVRLFDAGGLVIKKFIGRSLSPKIKCLAGVLADGYHVYGCGVAAVHNGGTGGGASDGAVQRWWRPILVLCNDGGSYF
ncbi:hypothetical protein Dimus_015391, partial [Dionaea muscipula]